MASQQSSNGGGGGGAPRPLQMGAKGAYIVRLLMVGDSSCGKTSLVLRFDQNVFSTKFVTTIGVDYRDKMVKVSLNINITRRINQLFTWRWLIPLGNVKVSSTNEGQISPNTRPTLGYSHLLLCLFLEQVNLRPHSHKYHQL